MERLIDVENRHLRLLRELLSAYLTNKTVWAYGSRVKWKASSVSDLDLVVWGATGLEVANAKDAFVESDLPFTVQLLVWEDIPEDFKENIRKKYVVLQEGNKIPKGWREVRLGAVAKFSNGKEKPKVNGSVPVYGGNGILGYTSNNNCDGETIILGRVGAYCGSVYFEDRPVWVSDNAILTKPKDNNDAKYLYYCLQNMHLNKIAQGSSHPLITQNLLNSLNVLVCGNEKEQKAIAEVLSSLDDKIDLLHRQNKTLENIAQTLFRQWFVEEADEGWEVGKLKEIIDISSGKGLAMNDCTLNGKYPVLGANGEIGRISNYLFSERLIYTGRVGTLGKVFILNEKAWLSDNTLIIQPKDNFFYYVYFLLKNAKLERLNIGSTQPLIKQSDIKNIRISLPNQSLLQNFEIQTNIFFSRIHHNQCQTRILKKLRDTLLPKLMSGEIRTELNFE